MTEREFVLARLAELRALAEAATPGPWEAWQDPGTNAIRIRMGLPPFDHDPEPSPYWSVQVEGSIFPEGAIAAFGAEEDRGKEDARFVAAHDPSLMAGVWGWLAAEAEQHQWVEGESPCDSRDCCAGPHRDTYCEGCGEIADGEDCAWLARLAASLGYGTGGGGEPHKHPEGGSHQHPYQGVGHLLTPYHEVPPSNPAPQGCESDASHTDLFGVLVSDAIAASPASQGAPPPGDDRCGHKSGRFRCEQRAGHTGTTHGIPGFAVWQEGPPPPPAVPEAPAPEGANEPWKAHVWPCTLFYVGAWGEFGQRFNYDCTCPPRPPSAEAATPHAEGEPDDEFCQVYTEDPTLGWGWQCFRCGAVAGPAMLFAKAEAGRDQHIDLHRSAAAAWGAPPVSAPAGEAERCGYEFQPSGIPCPLTRAQHGARGAQSHVFVPVSAPAQGAGE